MKKGLLILGIFLFSLPAFAQFRIGLKIAPLVAWLKSETEDVGSSKVKIGFNYGAMVDRLFTENYAFGTGVEITSKGGTLQDERGDSSITTTKYYLKYLEIPLTLKMRTNDFDVISFWGQFGLAAAFNIKASADKETLQTNFKKEGVDVKDDIRFFNSSLIVAIGVEYAIGDRTAAFCGFTFNNGFIDILKDKDLKVNNNYIALNIGLIF